MFSRYVPLVIAAGALAWGGVSTVHVVERSDVQDGKAFGSSGPYESIAAKAYFTADPKLAQNRIITDVDKAPRNENGLVEWSADVYVLKPRDPARGNGTALFEVSNRGNKGMLSTFALSQDDGFLMERGYTLVWVGWQFDVPRKEALLRLYPPVAKGVTGAVRAEFVPDAKTTTMPLADRNHIPYPVADLNDRSVQLTVRDRPDGVRKAIPRSQWKFLDEGHVEMASGFLPGKFYEVVYQSQDPAIVGLGPAAVRDFISFLKYGGGDAVALLGEHRRYIKRAIGFGTSQSGRFLRTFLYCGFNEDEKGRKVFDGVWANVAGAGRGSFNHRFAQASRDGHRMLNSFYPTDIFPFTDLEQSDPETGLSGGILEKAERSKVVPKIFYTNTAYEYWGRAASLIHTRLDGAQDAPLAPDTRVYFIAGAQHGPGSFPPVRKVTQNLPNVNNFRYIMRALLVAMNDWLTSGKEPPDSEYPMVAKGQLTPAGELRFPKIPGVRLPYAPHQARRVDYGPEFRTAGIVTIDPPKAGKVFPIRVPRVDHDGNEDAGIRMPEVQVPLATYTGWNLRDPKLGAADELSDMIGSWIPFASTKAARAKANDPRLSIEERYRSKQEYLGRIGAAAKSLVGDGFLLEQDVTAITERASRMWDHLVGRIK